MVPDEVPAGAAPAAPSSGRNAALVATGILLSRLSGLVRQRVVGHFFGVSAITDAFSAAFRIPNLLQNLLGEGTLSASFIPVYSRLLAEGRDEDAGRVAGAVAGLLAVAAGGAILVLVALADPITSLIAPGLDDATHELTVSLLRIIAPGLGFLVMSAWALGVLNSHRRFFLSYVAPVLWNGAQIAFLVVGGVLLLADPLAPGTATTDQLESLVHALAVGTVVGGAIQFGVQLPAVGRLVRHRPTLEASHPGVRRVGRAFAPVVLSRGIVQVTAFVELILASLLVEGAIAALFVAQQLYFLPISLFGLSVAAAELPDLSADRPDGERLGARLGDGLRRIAFFVVPTVVAYLVIGDKLVGALYRTGAFGRPDEVVVWLVLAGMALGLLATTTSRLLQSALYAVGDTARPARYSVVRVVISLAVGGLLMLQLDRLAVDAAGNVLQVGDLPALSLLADEARLAGVLHLGAAGLALGTAFGAWVEWLLLRRAVRERFGIQPRIGSHRGVLVVGAVVVAVVAALGRLLVDGWHPFPGALVAGGLAGAAWLVVCRRGGVPEMALDWRSLLTR